MIEIKKKGNVARALPSAVLWTVTRNNLVFVWPHLGTDSLLKDVAQPEGQSQFHTYSIKKDNGCIR